MRPGLHWTFGFWILPEERSFLLLTYCYSGLDTFLALRSSLLKFSLKPWPLLLATMILGASMQSLLDVT